MLIPDVRIGIIHNGHVRVALPVPAENKGSLFLHGLDFRPGQNIHTLILAACAALVEK